MTSEIMFTHLTASAKIEIKSSLQQCLWLDGECHRDVHLKCSTSHHKYLETSHPENTWSERPWADFISRTEFQIINLNLLHPAVIWCTLSSVQAVSSWSKRKNWKYSKKWEMSREFQTYSTINISNLNLRAKEQVKILIVE